MPEWLNAEALHDLWKAGLGIGGVALVLYVLNVLTGDDDG